MAHILKYYRSAFVLEQSKLTRLITVLREKYAFSNGGPRESYQVRFLDGTFVQVHSVERVYEFHNSGKKQIEQLEIDFQSHSQASTDADPIDQNARIEFSNEHSGRVLISVGDADPKNAAEVFAAVEEQVERTFKKGFMYTVSGRQAHLLAMGISLFLGILLAFVATPRHRDLMSQMWLTKAQILEIAAEIEKEPILSQEQQSSIIQRQLKNIQRSLQEPLIKVTWPVILVFAPLLIVFVAFIYLIYRCYPHVVFLWGDTEEWYQNILKRRHVVWNTIIISTGVGILSSLFVLGLDKYLR